LKQAKLVKPKVLTALLETVLDLTAKTQKVVQTAIQETVLVTVRRMAQKARMARKVAQRTTLKAMLRIKLVKQVKQKVLTALLAQMVELKAKTIVVVQKAIQEAVQVMVPQVRLLVRVVLLVAQRAMLAATQRVKLAQQVEQVEQLRRIKPKLQTLDRTVRVRQVAQRMALDAMTKPIFRLLTKATAKIKLKVTSTMLAEFRWAVLLACHQGCSRAPKGLRLRAAWLWVQVGIIRRAMLVAG